MNSQSPKLKSTALILLGVSLVLVVAYLHWSSGPAAEKKTDLQSTSTPLGFDAGIAPVLLPPATARASSNEARLDEESRELRYRSTIRREYSNTADLPDGVSFSVTLAFLMNMKSSDPAEAMHFVMQKMVVSNVDAGHILDLLSAAHESLRKQVLAKRRDALCAGATPRVFGDEVYSLFEELDDHQDAEAEKLYRSVLEEMSAENAEKFRTWIDGAKLSTVSVRYNHKKHYEYMGAIGDTRAAELCLAWSKIELGS